MKLAVPWIEPKASSIAGFKALTDTMKLALHGVLVILTWTAVSFGQSPATTSSASESQSALCFVPSPDSYVELQGTATIGDWTCRSSDVAGRVLLHVNWPLFNSAFEKLQSSSSVSKEKQGGNADHPSFKNPPSAELSVPVATLNANNAPMERDLRRALKEHEHPMVTFEYQKLESIQTNWNSQTKRLEIQLRILGQLSMAGARREISMDVIIVRDSPQHFHLHSRTLLLMSDFGIIPPSALLGLIRAHNLVFVIFDLNLIPADSPN